MNPKLSFIFSRRSVRGYSRKPVPDDMVRDLLEAAMAAPSACAKDPWHFITVRDSETRALLSEGLPNGRFLADAPLGIVVCGELARAHAQEESYMLQDCSAAVENLLLAANALGLGACWLGVHPRPDRIAHVRAVLKIPETITPMAVLAAGWPETTPAPRTRYSDKAVHNDKWNS